MRFFRSAFLFFSCLLCSACCWAAKVNLHNTKRLVIPVDDVTPKITSEDVAKIIPTDVHNGDSTSTVMTRIADKTFNLWFNSDAMRGSTLVRITEKTQETLKTDVVVPSTSPADISHRFSFKVEAFQALAKLEYSGWWKANINYDAKSSATNFEVKEKVFRNKELLLTHKANSEQDLSMIGLAWSW